MVDSCSQGVHSENAQANCSKVCHCSAIHVADFIHWSLAKQNECLIHLADLKGDKANNILTIFQGHSILQSLLVNEIKQDTFFATNFAV